ncbi:hypothetical protein [Streptococcus sp. S784/96/1]|uniref:hypothetical protein n=1 Tax=Streptococcus sp. S784/96/1 TaxID=2653499 RepID=UPI00138699B9|nr:hypothetical protein [Streptococcus sp. S784/96/1]
MEKQEVTFNQSDWSNEEKATTKKVTVKGILGQVFGWLLRAVLFVIATPFFIVIWTMNFLKSLFGIFMFWVVGKFCLVIFSYMLGFALVHLKILANDTAESWFSSLSGFLFGSSSDTLEKLFPHGAIEYWTIFIIALILATVTTIFRDEM